MIDPPVPQSSHRDDAAADASRARLEREHAQLVSLIEHSSDFIALADLSGTLTYMNAAGRRMIGLDDARDLSTVRITDYVPPEWIEQFRSEIIPYVVAHGTWEGEMQLMHLVTGERIDVFRYTYLVRDNASGEPAGFGTVTRDITAQKRAAEDLKRSEELVRTIAENSTQGVAMMDERGYCTYANHALLAMTGFSADEIRSKPLHDLIHHHYPDGRPFPMSECPIDRALPENFDVRAREDTFFRRDLSPFPVLCAASPIFKDGRPVSTVVEVRDVTEAQRAEDALRKSEQDFRTLADNISQLAWMTDETGSIFWYNQRWFDYTGTTLEEMRGWGWQSVHHPDFVDGVTERFKAAVESGQAWEDTFPLRGRDGNYRWFLSRAQPIRDADGRIVRWFGTNTDVTDLRVAQEALRRADRLKDEFLATLSHELRTPLTAILGWAHMLKGGMLEAEETQLAIDTIQRSAKTQSDLIEDVLDISRITSGKMRLERRAEDPASVAEAALGTVGPAAEARGITLVADLDRTIGTAFVDPDRLQQILWNLLSNAIKFSPKGSRVTLRLRASESEFQYDVQDEGPGIDPAFLPFLFDRFRQGDSTTRRSFGGLGIGLALARELAQLHGGGVSVETEPGKGATFRVRIPIVRPPLEPLAAGSGVAIGGVRLLLVSEERDRRGALGAWLKRLGAEIREADAFAGAVEALSPRPDVILVDTGLRDRAAYKLLSAVRSSEQGRGIAVIAITPPGRSNTQLPGLPVFDAYVDQPTDASQVLRAIARVLPSR